MKPTTLAALMSALRKPGSGCPWDLEQDHQTLARYLREEAAETLDALAAHVPGDPEKERHLCEELGDLWLQVVFHAQLARERGAWDLHDVEQMIVQKLVRRHPHVFGECDVANADEVLVNWKAIKKEEKAELGHDTSPRLMDGIAKSLALGRGSGDREALREGGLRVARYGRRAGQGEGGDRRAPGGEQPGAGGG